MNRLALLSVLASPIVAQSWMLSPRYYNSLFGPSLFDQMLTTTTTPNRAITMVPQPSSLLRQLIDETNQIQQQMMSLSMSSVLPTSSYEYLNNESNITIRMKVIPDQMPLENIHVQYDEPNQLLWIRGKYDHVKEHTHEEANGSTVTSENATGPKSTSKSSSHYEFSQTFALNPKLVNVEQLTAQYNNDDHTLTVTVPKYEIKEQEQLPPSIRTIPIMNATNTPSNPTIQNGSTTNEAIKPTVNATAEPAMTH